MTLEAQTREASGRVLPASNAVRALAWLLALGSVAFAVVNLVFELTDHFEEGPTPELAAGLSIANWLVAGLKVIGALVAILSVARRGRLSPRLVNMLVWAAACTLTIYALGSVVQALGMATGIAGSIESIDLAGILYVLGFLLAGTGFVVLAVSHSRRSGLGAGTALLGSLGGLAVLGVILLALPLLLDALGIMPLG